MAPKGQSTRPTSDRTRQALFNVIEHAAWAPPLEGARVLDVFAGSGALGIEALSRGAESACFIERDPEAVRTLEANLRALGVSSRGRALRLDAVRLPPASADAGFDMVFLDPPYGRGLVEEALARLGEAGWLSHTRLIVAELAEADLFTPPQGWTLRDQRTWGVAAVYLLTPA